MRRAANGLKRLVAAQLSEQLADDLRHLFLDGGSVELSAGSSHVFLRPAQSGRTKRAAAQENFAARGAACCGNLTCCFRGAPCGIHWQATNQESFHSGG